eukprot:symbB.v1.2.007812.t1/scaffold487.1/size197638/2
MAMSSASGEQVEAAMISMSGFSDETPPGLPTSQMGSMEDRVERLKQQRKEKAARSAKQKEIFHHEMEKQYTEQQAIEEMLQHNIPNDWSSIRGKEEMQDRPDSFELCASNQSEASSGSMSSSSSVSSSHAVVHEQVARMVNHRRSSSPKVDEASGRSERRAWLAQEPSAPTRSVGGQGGYVNVVVPTSEEVSPSNKRKSVTRIRVEL